MRCANNIECVFSGLPNVPMVVQRFRVEAHQLCAYDYLQVGTDKFCGTSGPAGITATDRTMTFNTYSSVTVTPRNHQVTPRHHHVTPCTAARCDVTSYNEM